MPLELVLEILGGVFGRVIALHRHGRPSQIAGLVIAVPLLAGVDQVRGPERWYVVNDSVVVAAPPAPVWRHVVSLSELAPPTEALFRLGVAYPRRARIDGTGAGAVRYCEFSTGTFVEPITQWRAPGRVPFVHSAQPGPPPAPAPPGALRPPP